jgi:hypothetical protein
VGLKILEANMYLMVRFITVICLAGFLFVSVANSAEETKPEAKKATFTQGQLAVAIVRSLGLEEEIGNDQSFVAYTQFLAGRGICPIGGWDINLEVSKDVLAVVVVQTLGLMSEVQDKTNVADYIRVLDDRDISIEDVRKVLSNIFVVNVLTDIVGTTPTDFDRPLSTVTGF